MAGHEHHKDDLPLGVMPPNFDAEYVAHVVTPFLQSSAYGGETPSVPMIDLELSKEGAIPIHLWGMFYQNWIPDPDKEGRSVFTQGYAGRGPANERKRIYMSATTPDLIDSKYRAKIAGFFNRVLAAENVDTPIMQNYFRHYADLYWDLHVGARGAEIPAVVRQFSESFNAVLGYWFPTTAIVYKAYMETRAALPALKAWVDDRVRKIIDGTQPDADGTLVHYWIKNGGLGENFRRIDIVFECFHNFLATSQWGNMVYNVAAKLEPANGDATVRDWFEKVMTKDPDASDGSPYTPLDRFVMELFRMISPNAFSLSSLSRFRHLLGTNYSSILTVHSKASTDPRHWINPTTFDPDRYKTAPTSHAAGNLPAPPAGLAQCPFQHTRLRTRDGRPVELANSAFGAVYPIIDGKAHPVVDTAGYAPFGFGYRRCAGEHLTVELVKEFLRKIWCDKLTFTKLETGKPIPVNPGTVLTDNIVLSRRP